MDHLTRENFLQDWCATLGENRWLTVESVIEYVNIRESKLREAVGPEQSRAAPPEDTSFDEILVGDTVYRRAGGYREHKSTGRNLRVYNEEGNPLTQVAELHVETTAELISQLDSCIEVGQPGPRTRAALKAARSALERAPATGVFSQFDCLKRWAASDEFWDAQMYGNRFYYGAGGLDYVPRDVLRELAKQLGLDETESGASVD
jgi:hypothetical protein